MNRGKFDGEMLHCPKCGKEYASFYEECPFCETERTSRTVQKYGRRQSAAERIGTLVLSLLLVIGGGYLLLSLVTSDGLGVGREYAVTTKAPEAMQMSVTKQEVALSSQTPEETDAGETTAATETLDEDDQEDGDTEQDQDADQEDQSWSEGD